MRKNPKPLGELYKNGGEYGSPGFEVCEVCCTHGWMESSPCMAPCIYCERGRAERKRLDDQNFERMAMDAEHKIKRLEELSREYNKIEEELQNLVDNGWLDENYKPIPKNFA